MFPHSCTYEPFFPVEWDGLDLTSAKAATPRWYGVSIGNGNNGVSHMFPDYYVRTSDPWFLASVATVASFKPSFQEAALEAVFIDGEADYTINAMISDPEKVDPSEAPDPLYTLYYDCPQCGETWTCEDQTDRDHTDDCPECEAMDIDPDEYEEQERDPDDSYSAAYGAWFILEVFPIQPDEMRDNRDQYESLDEAFDADILAMAQEK